MGADLISYGQLTYRYFYLRHKTISAFKSFQLPAINPVAILGLANSDWEMPHLVLKLPVFSNGD